MSSLSEVPGICDLCQWDDRTGDSLIAPARYCHREWKAVLGKFESDAGLFDVAYRLGAIALLAIATLASYFLAAVGCLVKFTALQLQEARPHWAGAFSQARIAKEFQELDKLIVDVSKHPGFSEGIKQTDRNRYTNILPNNATRFKHSADQEFYFNANSILGGKFIASQGPKPEEITQFWEMIWDSKASAIVKLVNPVESRRDKCAVYWPEEVGRPLTLDNGLKITLINQELLVLGNETAETKRKPDVPRSIKRVFEMQKDNEKCKIAQFDLENWPDHGVVPTKVLVNHVQAVHDYIQDRSGPIVAHCSAGIGRTGTFVATYETYDLYLQGNRNPDLIYNTVAHMRGLETGRNGMVQQEEQYELIYTASKELIAPTP